MARVVPPLQSQVQYLECLEENLLVSDVSNWQMTTAAASSENLKDQSSVVDYYHLRKCVEPTVSKPLLGLINWSKQQRQVISYSFN